MLETWIRSLLRREWQPTPIFLAGEFYEQRSLVGCSPWGRKESDTTELNWTDTICILPVSQDYCFLYNQVYAAAAAKLLQSCPTLCDPIEGSPPGSTIPGIVQARTLEWVAISFSNATKWKVKVKSLSRVQHFATQWTAAYQSPPSMGFSRQEYWSGLPLPSLKQVYSL